MERNLRAGGAVVARGGEFDRWDLQVRGGGLGAVRLRMTIEEHGSGKQMARFRVWPRWSMGAVAFIGACVAAAGVSGAVGCWAACVGAGALAVGAIGRAVWESRAGAGAVRAAARVE
jgi:O-antigen biosynthesis protein